MPSYHPRHKEGIIGTGEQVWKDVEGKPTIDVQKRAHASINGLLGSAVEPESRPLAAIGWKIDLEKTGGTAGLNDQGQPGWSTYAKHPDAKPVFAGREFPTDFPKVAPTIRHIKGLGVPTPEQYSTQLLTSIVHEYERFMREHGKDSNKTWEINGATVSIFDAANPYTGRGLRIKKGDQYYKIMLTQKYLRENNRHAWSVYIDNDIEQAKEKDTRTGKNFKLAPEGDAHFAARICKDTYDIHREDMLDAEEIELLEKINTLLN